MSSVLSSSLLLACHLGRPPATGPGAEVGAYSAVEAGHPVLRVDVPMAEPGLGEALRGAVAAGLAQREALGRTPPLQVLVLSATTELVAVDGARRVQRAALVIEAQVLGPAPRTVVLRGERSYEQDASDGLNAAQQRAAAYALIARELGLDLAAWLLHAPPPPQEHP